MSQSLTIYSVFFLCSSLVSFFVAFLAWQRKSVNGAKELTWLMLAAGLWSFFLIFETDSTSEFEKIFWSKLAYIGAVSTPIFYLLFVLRYTGKGKSVSVIKKLSLFIIPAIILILALTNETHKLIWSGFSPISEKTNMMEYYHGPVFWIGYMGYNYLMLLLGTVFLVQFIIRHSKTYLVQGSAIFIASLFPWLASVVYVAGINPLPGLDIVPASMILSGILFAYSILYIRFLDLAPKAREILVENLSDGILVLDGQNRIQDINDAALEFLGIKDENVIGLAVESSGAFYSDMMKAALTQESIDEIENLYDGVYRTFRIIKQEIKNHQGSRLIILRDITERKKEEETLHYERTLLRTIIDLIPEAIYVKDLECRKILANPKEVFLSGKNSENEIIGKTDFSLLPEDDAMRAQEEDNLVLKSRNSLIDADGKMIDKEGRQRFLLISKVPLLDSAGRITGLVGVSRDITEQKLIQLGLERSEKRYRELTELLPEMICEVNVNGQLTYVNQFAISKFGYIKEEIWSSPFDIFNIFNKKEKPRLARNMELVLQNGASFSNEYEAIKKNGEIFPVIVYSSPIYNEDAIVGIRGVMIDITDRKKHEMEISKNLRKQEMLSQISLNYNSLKDFDDKTRLALSIIGEHIQVSRVFIFEDSTDGLYTINTYEWCNKGIVSQVVEHKNFSYSEIPSWKSMLLKSGIVYSDKIEELPQDIRKVLESRHSRSIVAFPLLVDGKFMGFIGFEECSIDRKWSRSELELFRTISNLISNSFMRDVINNELINRVKENRGIINSIPDQIIRFSDSGTIISYESSKNDGLFVNYKLGLNDNVISLFEKELANSFLKAIQQCLIDGIFKFDFTFLNWDEIEYYEARFVKLKDTEVLAIIRNVTEIKENEKQLQIAKIKAEEASRAKSEFLANVSHEIRTPMNAILGFSEWLHDNVTNELHKSYLHTIMSSGRNLLALINDILDLSKIESGKMTIHMDSMQCKVVINEIEQVLKQKIDSKGLAFNVIIDQSVPDYIYMDEIRFYQILFNIISNAVKFTGNGYIQVSVMTTPSLSDNSINLIVSIEDTGIGINDDQQELIFQAFTQQSGQSNRHYEGTGLGLSIVSGLLKKLNGEVKLQSKAGRGSNFTLTFKDVRIADLEEQTKTTIESKQKLVLNPCKILIVDDVNYNIEVLKRLIDSEQVTFLEAVDGEQSLDILKTEIPDIIFMDIRMPGMSGYSVTEIIKKDSQLCKIPVVAFTASTMEDEKDRIDGLFDAFLQKPVFKKDVQDVLTRFLPHQFEIQEKTEIEKNASAISDNCLESLPEVLQTLENIYMKEWEKIKDDLILYDIKDFNKRLSDFAAENECKTLSQYCQELNFGLQSFDIEMIKNKIAEFPWTISKLSSYL